MIDKINSERHEHILTIEDPIEYIHQHKNCLVNQREVHSDTDSFSQRAARRAARGSRHRPHRRDARSGDRRSGAEDRRDRPPDVRHAAHELGGADDQPHHRHLPGRTSRRRSGRSCRSCSRASSVRRCCRGPTARAASCSLEIMVPTPAIRNLIRDDKIHQIYGAMQTGQEKLGMQTANQSLASLYMKRLITLETAMAASSNKDELQDMINRGVGVVAGAGLGRAGRDGRRPRCRTRLDVERELRTRAKDRYADFCLFGTDARRTDRQRRARRRFDGRRGRGAAPRADHRHADHAGQGEGRGRRRRRRPARPARRSSAKNLAVFTRQFSVMIDAGLPLVQCLDILGTPGRGQELRRRHPRRRGRDVEVGRVAGRRDAQAPEDVRPAVHEHDRGRRGGRHPRHDSQAARDLHRKGRQAEGPGEVGDDLPGRRHRHRRRSWSASFCGRSSRPSPQLFAGLGAELPLPTRVVIALSNNLVRLLPVPASSAPASAAYGFRTVLRDRQRPPRRSTARR